MTFHRPERRARTVALLGLGFTLLLTAYFVVLALYSGSEALKALTRFAAVVNLIWFFLLLIFHQHVLVQDETFESEQLRKERESGIGGAAIFDMDDEQLLIARRRLRWMFRWLLPAFTIGIILALLVSGLTAWSWGFNRNVHAEGWAEINHADMVIWFIAGGAFLSFLLSRYVTGMARHSEWRMLRAGAGWLMGITLIAVALAASLSALHFFQTPVPERVLAFAVRILLLVLAVEITLNFVLDFYRPRTPGEEPRPAFDSRLLGLFSEPGGIARSIADAVNYQFGFEVSSTWFYQLLQRSVVPLIGFGAFILLAASSFIFIDNTEQAVISRFGKPLERVLGPGLHLKYPWPIDVAHKVATAQVHELQIGLEAADTPGEQADALILWTNKHKQEPHLEVLVATPKLAEFLNRIGKSADTQPAISPPSQGGATGAPNAESTPQPDIASTADTEPVPSDTATQPAGAHPSEAVAVSLMRIAVSIQYQIRDAHQWLTRYEEPLKMLQTLANREIIHFCASVEVNGLIGHQRGAIENALWQRVQQAANDADLGIDVVFLGLQGVHPPESTAQDFQDVIGAEQKSTASIRSADAESNKRLSEVAGDVTRANQLVKAIRALNELEGDASSTEEARDAQRRRVNALFFGDAEQKMQPVGGKAAERIVAARAERWQKENQAHALAMAFHQEMIAEKSTPEFYRMRKLFGALVQAGESLRKYVIAAEGTLQLNLQDPMSAPLDTAFEEKN